MTEQGICIDLGTNESPDAHICSCSPMYTGKHCEIKLQEKCSDLPCNKFDANATCYELHDDKFACKCSIGFEGSLCTNVDDCKDNPCQNGGVCTFTGFGYRCDCPTGFSGFNCETSIKRVYVLRVLF